MPVILFGGANIGIPPNLIAGVTCWLKADTGIEEATGDPAESADTVEFWRDEVAALDFKQATATNRPTYTTGLVNGYGAVQFDGVDNYLTTNGAGGNLSSYLNVTNAMVIGVARLVAVTTDVAGNPLNNDTLFTSSATNYATMWYRSSAGNEYNVSGNDGSLDIATKSGAVVGSWKIFTWYHTGGVLYGGVNDSRLASMSSVAHGNTTSLAVNGEIGRDDGGAVYTQIDVAEMAFFNAAVSEDDRIALDRYFAYKFDLSLSY
jgi:hypothetical protein